MAWMPQMHVFISSGEPSGDLHGANLARALLARDPATKLVGFGGDNMTAAGVDLMYPLTQLSVMWLSRSIVNLPKFFQLADRAERYFLRHKPDAVVVIDFPGFHWHIAKRAKAAGIPVYYFVPPQLWAWGGWRVRKMRRTVDAVLTALPFEEEWYAAKKVNTHYVGHPYFDELPRQTRNAEFMAEQRAKGKAIVAILPGSRNQEVSANLPLMLEAAKKISASRPNTRFLIAAFNEKQGRKAKELLAASGLTAEVHVQRTPEIIELCEACIAVSGSVGLELMYQLKPTVVVYQYSRLARAVSSMLMTCPYISLVNLLAKEEIFPEFLTYEDRTPDIARQILRWLNDAPSRAATVAKLQALRDIVAVPGACERAADFLVDAIATRQKPAAIRRAA